MATSSLIFAFLMFSLLLGDLSANNNKNGDQNVGGLHVFEFHGQHGGMGIGLKLVIVIIIIVLVLYIFIRYRTKRYVKRHLNQRAL